VSELRRVACLANAAEPLVSGYQVLSQASDALRAMLAKALKDSGAIQDEKGISFAPPFLQKAGPVEDKALYLWLYFVSENEHAKNRPVTFSGDGTIRPAPLALTLYYLVMPGLAEFDDSQAADDAVSQSAKILGAVLEAVHNQPVITVDRLATFETPRETAASEELHVSLCRLSVEELTRIWEALDQPFRLSICLKANIVRIDSGRTTLGPPVVSREFVSGRFKPSPAKSGAA
jgi:hypothetical protein